MKAPVAAPLRSALLVLVGGLLVGTVSGLDFGEAGFFARRAGLGAGPEALFGLATLSRTEAVGAAVGGLLTAPGLPPPAWSQAPFATRPKDKADPQALADYRKGLETQKAELRSWFIQDAVQSPSPLSIRLLLLWHGLFTTALSKVVAPGLLVQQDLMLRRLGSGSLGELLLAVCRDPAMLIYLDGASNVKGRPNENFAREFLELFTLGEGHYSEADIKAAARAFTGWTVDRASGLARFDPKRHDPGPETFLGQSGSFTDSDIVRIVLAQDRTAEYVAERFWTSFISSQPDPTEIKRLAAGFRDSGYQIRTLLTGILDSDAFWAQEGKGSLVASPFELLVGAIRTYDLEGYDPARLASALGKLGQDLFNPLSVKGWPSGEGWINDSTLLERRKNLEALLALLRNRGQSLESNLY